MAFVVPAAAELPAGGLEGAGYNCTSVVCMLWVQQRIKGVELHVLQSSRVVPLPAQSVAKLNANELDC